MRAAAVALLLVAGTAGAQVRPMPAYDDGGDARVYSYRDATSTADIRPRAAAEAARAADWACAGPGAKAKAVARCRRARIAAERQAAAEREMRAADEARMTAGYARAAACQAGDPSACY